jgi:hypothetical protein
MSDERAERRDAPSRRPYERPQVTWREPYEPVAVGFSCLKQPGNAPCAPGPETG